jgi:prefoldin subunit 5
VATGVGDTKTFQAFSQNDPTGSKCVLKTYNYDYVLGWLHFKNWTEINNSDNTMNENITRKSSFFDKVWQAFKGTGSNTDLVDEVTLVDFIDWLGSNINRASNYDKVCNYLEFTNSKTTSFEDIQRVIAGYKSRITDLTNQLNPLASEIKNKEEQVSRLKTQVTEIEKLNSELTKKLTEALNSLPGMQKVYEDRITVLQGQIDTLAKEKGESIATIQTLKTKVDDLIKNQTSVLTIKDLILLIIGKIKK